MTSKTITLPARVCGMLLGLSLGAALCSGQQNAQSDLKTVNNPGGGQFVYGSLTGQSSKVDGMVYMLHLVHNYFQAKPLPGKLMQSHDGSSLAAFFTLNAKTLGGRPIAGLVIISMPANGKPQAAVLYDNAGNFINSEPQMMKSLSTAWAGSLGGGSGNSPGGNSARGGGDRITASPSRSGAPGRLIAVTGGDRSAVVKFPEGWHLTAVAGGQLTAEGDRGEMIALGMIYQGIINPRTQAGQNLINGPMASRGPKVICPYSNDLFADYVCALNQVRRNNGKSQGAFNLTNESPAPGGGRAVIARFTVDFHDGMGLRDGTAKVSLLTSYGPGPTSFALGVSMSNIPVKYGNAADPVLAQVIASYSQDAQVIASEHASDMGRIHDQGVANQMQTDAINGRREASQQSYEGHMQALKQNDQAGDQHNADIDWQSKINQDYILDRSVIRDAADTVHATTGNNLADALVRSNPTQLEYVPNQQLIQGVDY